MSGKVRTEMSQNLVSMSENVRTKMSTTKSSTKLSVNNPLQQQLR